MRIIADIKKEHIDAARERVISSAVLSNDDLCLLLIGVIREQNALAKKHPTCLLAQKMAEVTERVDRNLCEFIALMDAM